MASTTPIGERKLPTVDEYQAALEKFRVGYDEVESVAYRFRSISQHWQDGEDLPTAIAVPTLEEIGRLFSFVSSVRSQHECMTRLLDQCDVSLEDLDCLRLDAEARADRAARDA